MQVSPLRIAKAPCFGPDENLKLVVGAVGDFEGQDALGLHAEAAPGLADDDAVAGVAGVVLDLDGLVDAEAGGAIGDGGDVLAAVVGDAGDAVAVHEQLGGGAGAFFAVEGAGVDDAAVGDAALRGEVFAAAAFELGGGRTAAASDQPGDDACDDEACGDTGGEARMREDAAPFNQALEPVAERRKIVEVMGHGRLSEHRTSS